MKLVFPIAIVQNDCKALLFFSAFWFLTCVGPKAASVFLGGSLWRGRLELEVATVFRMEGERDSIVQV